MTSCGSPNYAAPEVIEGLPYDGAQADLWSCGVILYALLTRSLPFESESLPELFEMIRNAEYDLPNYISIEARDLIINLLQVDPSKRLRTNQVLKHPWYASFLLMLLI